MPKINLGVKPGGVSHNVLTKLNGSDHRVFELDKKRKFDSNINQPRASIDVFLKKSSNMFVEERKFLQVRRNLV